ESRVHPSAATLPARTCRRAVGVTTRHVMSGSSRLVAIVSPAMLCCPQSGTSSCVRKSPQAITAFRIQLKIAAPRPCSRRRYRRCAGDIGPLIAYRARSMSRPSAHDPAPAVVLGGGIAGLAAARFLARRYPCVVVFERDRRTDVASPEEAFGSWERPGVPQFRHSHAFLARLRVVLLAHL